MLNEDLVDDDLVAAIVIGDQPRCACVILVDTSTSMMAGNAIDALNDGLQVFRDELLKDNLAKKRVEVAIVEFNSTVNVVQDFVLAKDFEPPTLNANGATAMGEGIEKAIELIKDRKEFYKDNGVPIFRPWIFMITDGAPTDSIDIATEKIKNGEREKSFMFFSVGVQNADMGILETISVRSPKHLNGMKFSKMFAWLSASLSGVSNSNVGEQVPLPKIDDWGSTT